MPALLPNVDPDGLLEYSVVYSDRSLNHMSMAFRSVMTDLSAWLREAYNGAATIIVPGSGTFAMEAVARQFATGETALVLRNGWFSFRWTQIFDAGSIPTREIVLKARRAKPGSQVPVAPTPVDEVVAAIREHKPAVVFAPHVETSAGLMLPDNYLAAVADAVHEVGGLFVLDGIASGLRFVDMKALGIDVLITAPQKGWSSTPCAGLVVLGERALERMSTTQSTSFACDLGAWLRIMQAYEAGGHAYHATMPTDGLRQLRDVLAEARNLGLAALEQRQIELGQRIRRALEDHGFPSVAAPGFHAPGVVVSYTTNPDVKSGKAFMEAGLQVAGGVPLRCDEGDDFQTFRIGLFGLDKLQDVDGTVQRFEAALGHLPAH